MLDFAARTRSALAARSVGKTATSFPKLPPSSANCSDAASGTVCKRLLHRHVRTAPVDALGHRHLVGVGDRRRGLARVSREVGDDEHARARDRGIGGLRRRDGSRRCARDRDDHDCGSEARASTVGVQSASPQGMGSTRAYLITLASVVPHFARARLALIWIAAAAAFLVVVQVLWGPPAGIVVQGALLGGLSALLALGLALVYRAHRILNFAQGDLGAAPASLAVLLVVTSGASWLVAFAAGLATAVVLGVLVEVLVIRRFFRAPRLVLSVATIGLAQVLAGIGLLLPGWFGVQLPPQSFPAPIDVSFTVEPLRFGGNDVVALIVIPLAFVGIAVFLRTRLGLAMRACADDVDRAALVGIPVRRVHSVVWAIAALLAFLAVFLRAGIVGLSLGTVLGPSLLLPALAAAVIGRMERLPTIAAAAIALGIVEQSVIWGWNQPSDVYPVLFVVVVVAVWLTPAGAGLRSRLEPSTWRRGARAASGPA